MRSTTLPAGELRTAWLAVAIAPLLLALGCALGGGGGGGGGSGPNVSVSPKFQPSAQLKSIDGKRLPVSVVVIDKRQQKGRTANDGREVLAEGDKGKVYIQRPVPGVFEDALKSGLQTAGYTITPDAPVVVEATVVDLPLQAWQFTHWGLPSERGSTLDALAGVVPGPVRDTAAQTVMNVVVRRRDTRLGFPHSVSTVASNRDSDPAVVERTLNQVLSGAVNEAVAKAAPDIEIATRTPVTAREIDGRSQEIIQQQQALAELKQEADVRVAALAKDRDDLEKMTRLIEEDRRQLQATAQADRQAIAKEQAALAVTQKGFDAQRTQIEKDRAGVVTQRTALDHEAARLTQERAKAVQERTAAEQERQALQAKFDQLTKQPPEQPGVKEALADVRQQQQAAAQRQATLDQQQQDVERRAADLAKRTGELTQKSGDVEKRATEVAQQAAGNERRAKELAEQDRTLAAAKVDVETRKQEVAEREAGLKAYVAALDGRAAASQALATELEQRKQELVTREASLQQWKQDLEARTAVRPPAGMSNPRKPLIIITEPAVSNQETTLPSLTISGVASDDRAIASLRAIVNGKPTDLALAAADPTGTKAVSVRIRPFALPTGAGEASVPGMQPAIPPGGAARSPSTGPAADTGQVASRKFSFDADLREGANEIVLEATDDEGLKTAEKLTPIFHKGPGRTFVISIGINDYTNKATVPPLRFAVSDATDVAATFDLLLTGPDKRVRQMLNEQATREDLTNFLFYRLPAEVAPADTVIIFFSGHGAPDTVADAKGNVETFLLPIDADPTKLFSSAIRMADVATILRRLRSERIIFLADTCYSGAAAGGADPGGRSVGVPGVATRAVGVRTLPRRPDGKGCAIITASTGIQVAQERAEIGHGIFSYYVLTGLRDGKADANGDGNVTVNELYAYLKDGVSKATNGSQVPQISCDPNAGDIVLTRAGKGK